MSEMVRVEVTQEDIEQGVVGKCSECPVALAMSRAFGYSISVNGYFAWPTGKDLRLSEKWPVYGSVYKWIMGFDSYPASAVPFSFEVPRQPNWVPDDDWEDS